jgi:glycosyltransferase involved in cell wall biosynthesis
MANLEPASITKLHIANEAFMEKKLKILTISDMPLSPSGVGTQTKYMIDSVLRTGKYRVISLGGAIKHPSYDPIKTEEHGDDWVIYPVDGYGTQEMLRSLIRSERPDILWFMTDPRFWGWLWEIENEIRPLMPMVYYHVWDNYPYPRYNSIFYNSNDVVLAISKVTEDIVRNVAPGVDCRYVPHSVDTDVFKKKDPEEVEGFRRHILGDNYSEDKMIFFWNNRNARRKQSGSLMFWFAKFLEKVGKDKACLVMHTEVKDQHGQDLEAIARNLDLNNGEILFSQTKVDANRLALMYNAADCTINVSDAEGFGLATLESLACETPIIVTMTGGLQEQVTDGENWFGVGIEPASKAIIGSQQIPYIYEDRLAEADVVDALLQIYNKSREEREALGASGRNHVLTNYNFEEYCSNWDKIFTDIHEKYGSWPTHKSAPPWTLEEVI